MQPERIGNSRACRSPEDTSLADERLSFGTLPSSFIADLAEVGFGSCEVIVTLPSPSGPEERTVLSHKRAP
jgi:hypothetical protein